MRGAADKSHPSSAPWLVIRHVEQEHIGTLASVWHAAGAEYRYVDVFRGDPIPQNAAGLPGLIIMGGPMGVYQADRYPFLAQEQNLIRHAVEAGVAVLGICLGAQLVAAALGGRVYPGPQKEIGWHAVEVTEPADSLMSALPSSFTAFHWHGDTFDLPAGAARLARSSLYENQAFRWGRNIYAFQFHFEVTAGMVTEWLQDAGCCAELAAAPDISAELIRRQTSEWAAPLEAMSSHLFRRFLEQALPFAQ